MGWSRCTPNGRKRPRKDRARHQADPEAPPTIPVALVLSFRLAADRLPPKAALTILGTTGWAAYEARDVAHDRS